MNRILISNVNEPEPTEESMDVIDLNHVAIHVADVDESSRFYGEILGLPSMERPGFVFPGAWFQLGHKEELHIIGNRSEENGDVRFHPRGTHFALQVESRDGAIAELESKGVACFNKQVRPDGALQVYIEDPDGYVIEICQLKDIHNA